MCPTNVAHAHLLHPVRARELINQLAWPRNLLVHSQAVQQHLRKQEAKNRIYYLCDNDPPCRQHRGICEDLHFWFIKSPHTGRVRKIQSPANHQLKLAILEKKFVIVEEVVLIQKLTGLVNYQTKFEALFSTVFSMSIQDYVHMRTCTQNVPITNPVPPRGILW